MQVSYNFTESDIENLKEAKKALHGIDCLEVLCEACPLSVNGYCLYNYLETLIAKAKNERG